MRKISKLFMFVLTFSLLIMLSACGKQETLTQTPAPDALVESEVQASEETTATPAPTDIPASVETAMPTEEPTGIPEDVHTQGIMREGLTAKQVAKEMGVGLNLGNTFDAYWEDAKNKTSGAQIIGYNKPSSYETCWGAIVTSPGAITGMKEAGFQTVRIPVYWGNMMRNDNTFTINEEYIARVQEVVDCCLENGLYVVINIHHYDAFLIKTHTEEDVLAAVEVVWTQIAEYFKNYSDYLVFEGFNEALGNVQAGVTYTEEQKYAYVNRMNQTFVDAVRATGGNNANRILIASGYWTNIDLTTAEEYKLPTDSAEDKLMVSVHYVDNAMYWTNKIGGQEWWDYSVAQCELLKEAFTDKGIPVFLGECTAGYDEERFAKDAFITDSTACIEKMMELITDYGFVPVLWDTYGGFYDRMNCKIKEAENAAMIERIAEKLKEE